MSDQPSERVLKAIGGMLCYDLKRDKKCPHCAEKAWRIAKQVLQAQQEDIAENATKALDRLAASQ